MMTTIVSKVENLGASDMSVGIFRLFRFFVCSLVISGQSRRRLRIDGRIHRSCLIRGWHELPSDLGDLRCRSTGAETLDVGCQSSTKLEAQYCPLVFKTTALFSRTSGALQMITSENDFTI